MYRLIKIIPVKSKDYWYTLHFEDGQGNVKIVIVENITGLKDVYMEGIV